MNSGFYLVCLVSCGICLSGFICFEVTSHCKKKEFLDFSSSCYWDLYFVFVFCFFGMVNPDLYGIGFDDDSYGLV